jgi:hypothetical protein
VRTAAATAAAAVVLALAGCGGGSEDYAGLTRDEADGRVAEVAHQAEADGVLARRLSAAMAGSPQEAMGRAGGVALGAGPELSGEAASVVEGKAPQTGDAAWVGSYALAGIGSALSACVYVWDGGSAVDVRPSC